MYGDWVSIVAVAACLVLAVSSLVSRRLDWRKGVTLALIWAAIFAGVTALITGIRG